jgi:hypothetical protein
MCRKQNVIIFKILEYRYNYYFYQAQWNNNAKFYTPRAETAIKMLFKQQLISTNELIINSSWLSKYSKKIISNISVGQSVKTQNPLL